MCEIIRSPRLGLQHAATESVAAAEDMLASLVERGLSPQKKRLFVIDGSKALRAAIRKVFGSAPMQRCRAHKLRNVLERLPEEQREQAKGDGALYKSSEDRAPHVAAAGDVMRYAG